MAKKGKKQAAPRRNVPASPPSRMAMHVPKWETAFFVLALVGILVTAHMNFWWMHYQDIPAAAQAEATCGLPGIGGSDSAFDCAGAFESGAGTLFGVPNAIWGLLFYLAVAGLTAAIVFGGAGERRVLMKKIRAGLLTFGLVYTLGLTFYQFVVLPKTCLLCLVSALIVLALFVVLVLYLRTEPTRERPTAPNLALYGGLAALALLLVGADFGYFSTQEVPTVAEAETPITEASDFDGAAVCKYFEGAPYYADYGMLVDEADATTGPATAPVTIIEYFDPNCPHCKTAYPNLKAAAARFPEDLRIVYKPVAVMGAQSNAQVAALLAAAEAGESAFFTMLEEQFENQKPRSGNTMDELREFARKAGFDDGRMAERIRDGEFRTRMSRDIRIFQRLGFTGVPTIVVNGRRIGTRSAQCISYFVEQALAEGTTPAATPADTSATG